MRIPLAALPILGLAILSGPSFAKDDSGLRFDPAIIQTCLDDGRARDCVGVAASACMEATEGGYTTRDMARCIAAELDWWDADLNASYQTLHSREQAADADWERPSGADALREVQRAWIAFRDASCRYEELQWWGGTGASVAGIACRKQMTAEQALTLRSYLADG